MTTVKGKNIMSIQYIPSLKKQGLYDPALEHDACGVGMVANIKGIKSHSIVQQGLEVLRNLEHRGARGSDPDTGDGAGILLQIPHSFFVNECTRLGWDLPEQGSYAIGMTFMPQDPKENADAIEIIERVVKDEGQIFLGWRNVPVDPNEIGPLARSVMPKISQFFISSSENTSSETHFESKLYVIRRRIENEIESSHFSEKDSFYICSLSSNRIVYKGLITAPQLEHFYEDLADSRVISSFTLVHSRFSTNTLGTWKLAHPYRFVIHNGEINTMRGNINWMAARERVFTSKAFGQDIKKLLPVIGEEIQSDTASFDNALELLLATGRSLPHSMMMMIPEAWGDHLPMQQNKRDFYEYHSSLMEAWDGPALMIATDGSQVCGVLDRNGLRPCRYLVTTDNLLVMASETGVLSVPNENVLYKARIEPGKMFLLDTKEGRLIDDDELKESLSSQQPYGEWLKNNQINLSELPAPVNLPENEPVDLLEQQKTFGYTTEDVHMIMEPMAVLGSEPTGSMGNDIPLAVLSDETPTLFSYFKQLFAQVSNPPLDAIREELVTSLSATIGEEKNLFEETPEHCRQLRLNRPIITNTELSSIKNLDIPNLKAKTLSTVFKTGDEGTMSLAVENLCAEASQAVAEGCSILILSDRGIQKDYAPIPSLLATSAVHHHLIRTGNRTKVGLVVESGEPREVSHFALLIGYGAGAINPYLAFATLSNLITSNNILSANIEYPQAEANYIKAIDKGILKVMSKMGISTIQSYRGAQQFEAVGLNQDFIDQYFSWTISRIGGIGINDIETESLKRHAEAYEDIGTSERSDLRSGGVYQWRRDGEFHMWNPDTIAKIQHATKTNSWESYKQFSTFSDTLNRRLCTIRGLLDFRESDNSIPLSEVEPAKEIVKRFATGAISLGSISREAHEALAIAMNRMQARSNTGEGGEDWHRYTPDDNGDLRNSAIKQVASGRFGVTINYLSSAHDLQIKMAQGAKPGEGGQLPGHKVDEYIGWVRNSTPGVELISPPPHHDIYSIEDLAQLIHDLKNSNPEARVQVKLVAEAGVGTIAAGVAKAHGDVVLISGDSGGTGASPESSIKHAGLPWELGLAETQQVLVLNDLRGRIVVQTDGQLKTGRDVAIACLLGAEEFGMATAPLISLGCIMLRKCHLNTCSVGVATQDPELRKMFTGKPEYVINYFFFVAEELRQIMSTLGFKKIDDMVGRMDKLESKEAILHWKAKGLNFANLLHMPKVPDSVATHRVQSQDHGLDRALDKELIRKSEKALNKQEPIAIDMSISNVNRTVGTTLSHEVAKRYGEKALPDDTITVNFNGSVGQSFSAFLAKGITMKVKGDGNDYFGKGLSGGKIIITPPEESTYCPEENILIGNVALYGATGGKAFIRGIAGERFGVRNSGAEAVVEGVGDHGCEYMTRGKVVVLGQTGRNFAAGMSGGEAFVLDEHNKFKNLCNMGMVGHEKIVSISDISILRQLIEEHYTYTGSANAKRILEDWDNMLTKFVKVMPHDYKRVLEERSKSKGAV